MRRSAGARRNRLGSALLVVASLAGTLLLVDLAMLLVLGPVRAVENFYEPDPRFGYRMRPHTEFTFASPYHGYEARVRTNALGLRDDEVPVPKPPGTRRVLLLGDSMTAGLEVAREASFEAVSEALLRRDDPRIEVLNAGVRGYNLDNILGWFEAVGLGLEPDLVVYVFTDNDLTSEPTFQPERGDISRGFTLGGLRGRIAAYSHLTYRAEILRQRFALRRQRDRVPQSPDKVLLPGGLVAFFTHSDWATTPAFQYTAARIHRMAEACAARAIPFVLAGAPQREEIDPETMAWWRAQLAPRFAHVDFDGARRYLDWVAERGGIERFDPVPVFRARRNADGDYWFHKDGHLNPRGHRLLAEHLAEHLRPWADGARSPRPASK